MKGHNVKRKITLWLTLLMALLTGLLLAFVLMVSRGVVEQSAQEQLCHTVQANTAQLTYHDGKLNLTENFMFYYNGVTTLIYSKNEALLAGQVPVAFHGQAPFASGLVQEVDGGQSRYFLLDLWVPDGWDNGVWLRGMIEAPATGQTARNLLLAAVIVLPAFLLLAALGSWLILRRSFRPLDRIHDTAAAIGEAKDLSRRIGLPPGGDEFSRLATTFDQLFARLERSFEAEKQFAADASHELRTPVAIIKSACEYGLRYDETPEERLETLQTIHRQTEHMAGLISGLLSMTRLEQGTERPSMVKVDLGQLAAQVMEETALNGRTVTARLSPGVTVMADPALLSRLLRNLLENAVKFTAPKGNILVEVAQTPAENLLRVADDGIGIAPEHQENVWQRFYQVDTARSEDASGAGLGLAMVSQIARLHGGFMTLESQPDKGSRFTLHLPRSNHK